MSNTIEFAIPSLEEVINLFDKSYTLVYVDYRDSLDNNLEEIQKAIHKQDMSYIWESTDDWVMDAQIYGLDSALDELKKEIKSTFDLESWQAEAVIEKYMDEIKEEIYNRDDSDVTHDLLRNTANPVCYYDTGYEVEEQTWCLDEKEFNNYIKEIKKVLKIKISDTTFDKELRELLANASYGGKLVVYFMGDIENLLSIKKNGFTRIRFDGAEVALVDHWNGSGHNVFIKHKFSFPLDVEKIIFDKTKRYSYTYEVCGMVSNWCDGTKYNLTLR